MRPFASQGTDCAKEWGWKQQEGMMELSTLWDGVEKPQRSPGHPLQGQSRGRGQAARAPSLPWGRGYRLALSPSTGGPHGATEPGARPASPHHGRARSAGAGATTGRAGGGWWKMNEGVGRLMALSGK